MNKIDDKASDFGYINLFLNNSTDQEVTALYQEDRNIPYLEQMELYKIAVSRFKVPTASLPLFEFEEVPTTGQSPYWVALTQGPNNDNPLYENVVYTNQRANTGNEKYIYDYQSFLDMVNTALRKLWVQAIGDATYNVSLVGAKIRTQENAPSLVLKIHLSISIYLEMMQTMIMVHHSINLLKMQMDQEQSRILM